MIKLHPKWHDKTKILMLRQKNRKAGEGTTVMFVSISDNNNELVSWTIHNIKSINGYKV